MQTKSGRPDRRGRVPVLAEAVRNFLPPLSPPATPPLSPDYPRPCSRCKTLTAETGFSVDRSKASGRRSYCRECDRQRRKAYYAEHREELYAQRQAVREAAWQAHLKELEKESRKRIAATKKMHAALERRQKELLRSLDVPDLSPEEVTERAQRRATSSMRDLRQ
jgi:hypothetical protein